MNDDQRRDAFHSALVTEHFVLQGSASSTISERPSRSSLYLLSLSSSLVALGFAAQASGDAFAPFAAAVLPAIFLLGLFTIVRLVDTSVENVVCLQRMAHIRRYYATLMPENAGYFPSTGSDTLDAQTMLGTGSGKSSVWFTMASMIGTVNAVLGGTAVALFLGGVLGLARPLAIGAGLVVAILLVVGVLAYQRRRFTRMFGA